MASTFSSDVEKLLKREGACVVGIASSEMFSEAPEGHRPWDLLSEARSVVVFGVEIPKGIVKSIPSIQYYFCYEALNRMLTEMAYRLALFIESKGYLAFPLSPTEPDPARKVMHISDEDYKTMASFSHRHAAAIAGIAEFTPAAYTVVKGLGPRVRLNSVITTAPLEPSQIKEAGLKWGNICKPWECGIQCVKACPSRALPGDGTINHVKCRKYRLKDASPEYFDRLKELAEKGISPVMRLAMLPTKSHQTELCGLCLKACPLSL